jgi:bacterioferritin-associated ferredoxin
MDVKSDFTATSEASTKPAPRFAAKIVCRCLDVSEAEIQEAVVTCNVQTVKELGVCTGAGQGCTACHAALRRYLEG